MGGGEAGAVRGGEARAGSGGEVMATLERTTDYSDIPGVSRGRERSDSADE